MKRIIYCLIICLSMGFISCNQNKITTIYLVRHAEKMRGGDDPKLNVAGIKRSVKLSEVLKEVDLAAIYSTDYLRTRYTAKPSAIKKNIETKIYDSSDQAYFADMILKKHNGRNILVVGHSNTIPMLVNILLGSDEYTQLDEDEYDKLFIVTLNQEESISAKVEIY